MGWWKRFNDWIDGSIDKATKSPLDDWEPFGFHGPALPVQAECSDVQEARDDSAPAAIPSTSDPSRSDDVSDGKSGNGDVTTETTLEHASVLPSATFRVFPMAGNHRNSYDSEDSVRRAVAARNRSRERWLAIPGAVWVSNVKVYRAETVWRDVTDEYVK